MSMDHIEENYVKSLQARVKELEAYSMGLEKSYSETLEENARLRKVVDAARESMKYTDVTFAPNFPEPIAKLKSALRELDGEGE